MATISKLALFWRAFFAVLLGGSMVAAASRSEVEAWQSAVSSNTADGYYQYLSLFPAGDYVDEAIAALARLGALGAPRNIGPSNPTGSGGPSGGATY
ncbi:hypothetical protein [Tabrizicola sp.]|uniref:hypothetical protein n=1 Tax=Tabrizicola sp. TaxID=2005166 RepID=UPI003F2ED634